MSCATVVGTAVSPITGGVDLVRLEVDQDNLGLTPLYFIGGVIGGPFVAFYNGVNFDATYWGRNFDEGFEYQDREFDRVFRPFELFRMGVREEQSEE